jgi:hypothetical protein
MRSFDLLMSILGKINFKFQKQQLSLFILNLIFLSMKLRKQRPLIYRVSLGPMVRTFALLIDMSLDVEILCSKLQGSLLPESLRGHIWINRSLRKFLSLSLPSLIISCCLLEIGKIPLLDPRGSMNYNALVVPCFNLSLIS